MATLRNAACRLVSKNAANCSLLARIFEVGPVDACFDSGNSDGHLFFGDGVSPDAHNIHPGIPAVNVLRSRRR